MQKTFVKRPVLSQNNIITNQCLPDFGTRSLKSTSALYSQSVSLRTQSITREHPDNHSDTLTPNLPYPSRPAGNNQAFIPGTTWTWPWVRFVCFDVLTSGTSLYLLFPYLSYLGARGEVFTDDNSKPKWPKKKNSFPRSQWRRFRCLRGRPQTEYARLLFWPTSTIKKKTNAREKSKTRLDSDFSKISRKTDRQRRERERGERERETQIRCTSLMETERSFLVFWNFSFLVLLLMNADHQRILHCLSRKQFDSLIFFYLWEQSFHSFVFTLRLWVWANSF